MVREDARCLQTLRAPDPIGTLPAVPEAPRKADDIEVLELIEGPLPHLHENGCTSERAGPPRGTAANTG